MIRVLKKKNQQIMSPRGPQLLGGLLHIYPVCTQLETALELARFSESTSGFSCTFSSVLTDDLSDQRQSVRCRVFRPAKLFQMCLTLDSGQTYELESGSKLKQVSPPHKFSKVRGLLPVALRLVPSSSLKALYAYFKQRKQQNILSVGFITCKSC